MSFLTRYTNMTRKMNQITAQPSHPLNTFWLPADFLCPHSAITTTQPFELGAPTEQPPAPVPSPALPGFFQPIPAVLKTMSKGLAIHNFYPHEKANSSGSQSHISPFERGSKSSFQVQNLLFCGVFFFLMNLIVCILVQTDVFAV